MASLLRQRLIEDLRIRHYADKTIDAYVRCVAKFAQFFGKSPGLLGAEEVRQYQKHLTEKEVSRSRFAQTSSALRFLYGVTLKRKGSVELDPLPQTGDTASGCTEPAGIAEVFLRRSRA